MPKNCANQAAAVLEGASGRTGGRSGEFIQTGDGDAGSQSIQAFLNELDADLQNRIQFNIKEDVQFSIGPEVRVVLRNLLKGMVDLTAGGPPPCIGCRGYGKIPLGAAGR